MGLRDTLQGLARMVSNAIAPSLVGKKVRVMIGDKEIHFSLQMPIEDLIQLARSLDKDIKVILEDKKDDP